MGLLETVFWSGVLGMCLYAALPQPPTLCEQLAFVMSFQLLLRFGVGFMDGLTMRDDADTEDP